MDEPLAQLTHGWVTKAMHDRQTAYITADAAHGPLDTAIYHCQQAAAKAVKAWLTANQIPFEKTHDIRRLIRYADRACPELASLTVEAATLTPYASVYRYPGLADDSGPSRQEFDTALRYARSVCDVVANSLPAEARP